MTTRHVGMWVAAVAFGMNAPVFAASIRSQNFVVEAATPELAKEFAQLAEGYRKSKSLEWLGREMPNWPQPCPLRVEVQNTGAGGATTFNFGGGQVSQSMQISGEYERLKNSVLPHEVTHTVFAHHFRQPVPRWADEGGSVLSEDDLERRRHDTMCRQLLNAGRGMQLQVLFSLKDYPKDVMVLYAQGFSITKFLVDQGGRATFLNFLASGMRNGWNASAQEFYQFETVQVMEKAWLDSLRRPAEHVARNDNRPTGRENPSAESTSRVVVKEYLQPNIDLDPPIVARGASPDGWNQPPVKFSEPRARTVAQPPVRVEDPRPPVKIVRPTAAPPSAGPPIVLFPPEPFPSR